jgi:hypothetical protein
MLHPFWQAVLLMPEEKHQARLEWWRAFTDSECICANAIHHADSTCICCCCCCRSTARRIKRKTAAQYENGFAADPEDCIESDDNSTTIAVSTPAAASAPTQMPQMHIGASGVTAAAGAAAGPNPYAGYAHDDSRETYSQYASQYAGGYAGVSAGGVAPLGAAAAAADAARARQDASVVGIGGSTSAGVGGGMQYQPTADGRRVSMF